MGRLGWGSPGCSGGALEPWGFPCEGVEMSLGGDKESLELEGVGRGGGRWLWSQEFVTMKDVDALGGARTSVLPGAWAV